MNIGDGDLVKVKKGVQSPDEPSEVLKVAEFHYLTMPDLNREGRTIVARCLRPSADPKAKDKYDDPNRFVNWPIQFLDLVSKAKRGPDPVEEDDEPEEPMDVPQDKIKPVVPAGK